MADESVKDETLRAVLGPIDNELDLGLGLSDVIDVIQTTDPTTAQEMFAQSNDLNRITDNQMNQHNTHNYNNSNMTNQKTSRPSGNDGNPTNRPSVTNSHSVRRRNYVQIIEQPAPKALRFRYECEGRSAGSIPGVNSTAENKTYPTIQICGEYRGRAVVVVSCVTKDEPYKPHPHNLVGKEGCKKGVCTVEVNTDTMSVTFSNLGIQCVKKKDIEEALRVREEIRVDPFRTGFAHKTGTSIDLNTVRLCFQVFLESSEHKGKFTVPLDPVVSDPIFDKKGIQDLAISDISHTSCPVSGGTKIMLFCEKVAKDDVQVRFFEVDMQGKLLWEANGEFQPCNVHKQVAISFRAPPYRRLPITEPVKVLIQLKRPSDGATSDPVEIDYIPSETGMRSFESLREKFQGVPDQTDIFQRIFMDKRYEKYLSNDKENEEPVEVVVLDSPVESKNIASTSQLPVNDASIEAQSLEKTIEWLEKAEFNGLMNADMIRNFGLNKDNSLNELLEQVAELDEIYSDHRLKRDTANVEKELNGYEYALPADPLDQMQADENFDDTATYSSLQIAFKNPIPMIDFVPPSPPVHKLPNGFPDDLDDMIVNPMAPIIDVGGVKRDNPGMDDEKLPPLPPKRVKKPLQSPTDDDFDTNQPYLTSVETLRQHLDETMNHSRQGSTRSLSGRPQSQIIIMKTPDQSPINKRLPPPPPINQNCPTSPSKHKSSFFSKLFSRRKSKPEVCNTPGPSCTISSSRTSPNISREPSIGNFDQFDSNRASVRSVKSLQPTSSNENSPRKYGKPVGRSVSSVSGKRPHLTPDIIHIPLKGDYTSNMPMRSGSGNLLTPGSPGAMTLNNNLDRKTVSALQLADLPLQEGNMELIAIADAQSLKNLCEGEFGVQLDPSVDLTEAEHYALYTSVAPNATSSEFDDGSQYYAPVNEGEILKPSELEQQIRNKA